jgi:hypothetical protein
MTLVLGAGFVQARSSSISYRFRAFGKGDKWTKELSGPTCLMKDLKRYKPETMNLSRYGGLEGAKFSSTGFFRTEKIKDRWFFIDPDGHPYIMLGLAAVAPFDDRNEKAYFGPYDDADDWAEKTTEKLRALGFNSSGPWSSDEALQSQAHPLNYTVSIYVAYTFARKYYENNKAGVHNMEFANDIMPILDPRFEEYAVKQVQSSIKKKWIKDPRLVGYFVDNELPWKEDSLKRFLELDHADINYQKTIEWLVDEKGLSQKKAERLKPDRLDEELSSEFLTFLANHYYSTVKRALLAADPNHLYLGSRLHLPYTQSREAISAMGKHVDVMSVNYYHRWTPSQDELDQWADWSGKPCLISEWYAKGGDSDCDNVSGAGLLVETQQERGDYYQTFTLGLLENPNCIGWHWYKYKDSPTKGKDSNRGFFNKTFGDYLPLQEAAREVNTQVYPLIQYLDKN